MSKFTGVNMEWNNETACIHASKLVLKPHIILKPCLQ